MQIAIGVLALLKVIGEIYSDKLSKNWSSEIEDLQDRLWREINLPDEKKDMIRIDNMLQEINIRTAKMRRFMIENLLKK